MSLIALSRIPVEAAEGLEGTRTDTSATTLDCPIEAQEKSFWCWAAVGVSLARYYKQPHVRQCELAKRMMGGDCCGAKNCNRLWRLEDALGKDGVALLIESHERALGFDEVMDELGGRRPIALRIELKGGGGHFVVISGFDPATRMLSIGDPDPTFGEQHRTYDVLLTSYRGTWTHSFTLKDHAD